MKKIVTIAALLAACLLSASAQAQGTTSPAQPLTRAENAFSVDLYGKLRQQPGNLFFSPYSISAAIGMVFAGAKGGTATQIAKVLHLGLLEKASHSTDFRAVFLNAVKQQKLFYYPKTAGFRFVTANALWSSTKYSFNPAFIATVKDSFGGDLKSTNFSHEQAARDQINRWVADQTRGKIQNLIQPGMLTRATRMVLTDAIYFKDRWETPFEKAETTKGKFHVSASHDVATQMMNITGSFPLATMDGVKILSIPYQNDEASMVIILPDREEGLAAVEARLTTKKLNTWLKESQDTLVRLALPKFKNISAFELKDILMALGMKKAFNASQANLTDIADIPNAPLYIGDVIHQAFIAVDEQGTEASAATGVGVVAAAGIEPGPPPKPVPFIADHPFIYLIRTNHSGKILFMGRVADPTQQGS